MPRPTPIALLLLLAAAARADGLDQESARRLAEQGEILPLARIIEQLALPAQTRVIEVELERKGGRYLYEIEVLHADGLVEELKLDARDGRLLKRERE